MADKHWLPPLDSRVKMGKAQPLRHELPLPPLPQSAHQYSAKQPALTDHARIPKSHSSRTISHSASLHSNLNSLHPDGRGQPLPNSHSHLHSSHLMTQSYTNLNHASHSNHSNTTGRGYVTHSNPPSNPSSSSYLPLQNPPSGSSNYPDSGAPSHSNPHANPYSAPNSASHSSSSLISPPLNYAAPYPHSANASSSVSANHPHFGSHLHSAVPKPPQLPFQFAGNYQPRYTNGPARTHQRKTSWTANSTPPPSQGLYMHGNYTVDNVSHQRQPSQTSVSSNGSTSLNFAERKLRHERFYGGRQMDSTSSLASEGAQSARSSLYSGSQLGQAPSLPEGVSTLSQNSAVPPKVYPELPDKIPERNPERPPHSGTRGSGAMQSGTQAGSHSGMHIGTPLETNQGNYPRTNTELHSVTNSCAQAGIDKVGSNQAGMISALSNQSAQAVPLMPSWSMSATQHANLVGGKPPPLASNYAMMADLDAPPPVSHSEPVSPADSATQSERQAWSVASSQHTSPFVSSSRQAKKRDIPGFMSRLGSRISSQISSGFGSRASSGFRSRSQAASQAGSRAGSSMSTHGTPEPMPALSDLVLDDEEWPVYSPRRDPSDEVFEQISHLGENSMPITDIDPATKSVPMLLSRIPAHSDDAKEAQRFMPRGLYYYSEFNGAMDDDGNYNLVEGEHIGFRYSVVEALGKGSFGTVLKCRDHKSGRMVAVKVTTKRPELQSQVKVEASLLRSLLVDHHGHPESNHFVRYIEHFRFRGHMCITTELLGPNLYQLLKRNGHKGLEESTVRYITRQLCEGLEFLASQKIIHCDIKPENILISDLSKCQVKIIDFGSGCYEGRRLYTYIQSRFYRAPEILLGMPYAAAIDMWSVGAIVPELLLGSPLFPSSDEQDQVALMAQVLGSPPSAVLWRSSRSALFFDAHNVPLQLMNAKGEHRQMPGSTPLSELLSDFSKDALSFCESTLRWSPETRLKAEKAVYHPFVISQ